MSPGPRAAGHPEPHAHGSQSPEFVWALLNATGEGIYGVDLEGDGTFASRVRLAQPEPCA